MLTTTTLITAIKDHETTVDNGKDAGETIEYISEKWIYELIGKVRIKTKTIQVFMLLGLGKYLNNDSRTFASNHPLSLGI